MFGIQDNWLDLLTACHMLALQKYTLLVHVNGLHFRQFTHAKVTTISYIALLYY